MKVLLVHSFFRDQEMISNDSNDDIEDKVVKRQRTESSQNYRQLLKCNIQAQTAIVEDEFEEDNIRFGSQLKSTQRNISLSDPVEIMDLHIIKMEHKFNRLDAKLSNVFVERDCVNNNLHPSPASFPESRSDLFNLTEVQITPLLQYYCLANHGSLNDKRKRLAMHLGVIRLG